VFQAGRNVTSRDQNDILIVHPVENDLMVCLVYKEEEPVGFFRLNINPIVRGTRGKRKGFASTWR
jgi:hypothetical protein